MKGTLCVKSNKYYAVINYKDETGAWKKKWINTGISDKPGNKKLAQEFLQAEIEQFQYKQIQANESREESISETNVNSELSYLDSNDLSKMRFVDFVKKWLITKENEHSVAENTISFYQSLCNNHIIPYFDKTELTVSEVNYLELQNFIDYEKREGNGLKGQTGLSPASLKRLKTTLKLIFKEARKFNLITNDPCEFVTVPKQKRRLPTYYNENQLKELFEKTKDEQLFPVIYLTVVYGLRRSEVLGLKWDSIDFVNKTVTIMRVVVRFDEVIEKEDVKTESSYRTYPLSDEIENLLLQIKEEENRNREKYGSLYKENGYIFKWPDGDIFTPDYISRKFSSLLKKNNLPHIRFHDLRHSCASFLVSKGFQLKDVQEWLGHSDIETTANIYAHLDLQRKRVLMQSMKF